jgi:hypothetical protein
VNQQTSIQVRRASPTDIRTCVATDRLEAQDGEVILRVDQFAFTANNVTYAMFGDAMHYWDFFPTGDPQWGVIPVWGFATVEESAVDDIAVGERFYGYFPTSTHVVVQPEQVKRGGFVDAADHRAALPQVYNQYLRCSADPGYDASMEAQQMLLRPLFFTSYLIDDFLEDNAMFGARRMLLSSASSKTAYGTAFCLSRRHGMEVVGLTSAANIDFVRGLGCYHSVLEYAEVPHLSNSTPSVYVDFSGNVGLRRSVHTHLGDSLRYSASIGGTDWQHLGKVGELPGPRPTLFFAPSQIKKRVAEWGGGVLQERLAAAWKEFMVPVMRGDKPWLRVVHAQGPQAARAAMLEVITGQATPEAGHVLSLHA